MSDAVAVGEDQVRHLRQRLQRLQDRRQLAKRQQSGNVGHRGGNARQALRDHLQRLRIEQHDRRAGDLPLLLETHVDAGDQP
ncbi:hypothetical protein D3C77_685580 [compost metagenome]